jgi:membrane protease YdiL (CAAX protease family)
LCRAKVGRSSKLKVLDEHGVVDLLTVSIVAVMAALSVVAWSVVARRVWCQQPIVPLAPRRGVPWRFADLLMIAAFYVLAQFAFVQIGALVAKSTAGIEDLDIWQDSAEGATSAMKLTVVSAANIATNLVTIAFALLWIFAYRNVTWADLGWRPDIVRNDVRLGVMTFAAIAAPIYGLQAYLSQFVNQQHPLIEVLSRERTPLLMILGGVSAVAVAPFAEELFFRVLLQGWLESAGAASVGPAEHSTEPIEPTPRRTAILATSLIFALLHLGHGAAPIPLFFLALALGYLYQRTHRLLPSVTVHFLLNACSYAMLLFAQPQ